MTRHMTTTEETTAQLVIRAGRISVEQACMSFEDFCRSLLIGNTASETLEKIQQFDKDGADVTNLSECIYNNDLWFIYANWENEVQELFDETGLKWKNVPEAAQVAVSMCLSGMLYELIKEYEYKVEIETDNIETND